VGRADSPTAPAFAVPNFCRGEKGHVVDIISIIGLLDIGAKFRCPV
jgi:hypothetical protein